MKAPEWDGWESIVYDETQLRKRVRWVVETFTNPRWWRITFPGVSLLWVCWAGGATRYSLRPDLYDGDGFHRFRCWEWTTAAQSPGVYGNLAKCLHQVIWVPLILSAQRD